MIHKKTKNYVFDKNNALDSLKYSDWFVLDMLGYNLTSFGFKYMIQSIITKLSGDKGHEG